MGTLSAGLGAASILDGAEGGTSVATQLGYYVNFGRFVSVGPEFGYSRFGSALLQFPRDPSRIDRMSWRLGGAVRINGPFLADLRPYVLAGLGIYGWRWESTSINESLGGNAGLGVEWVMGELPSLALTLEMRAHAQLSDRYGQSSRSSYLSGIGGVAWSW